MVQVRQIFFSLLKRMKNLPYTVYRIRVSYLLLPDPFSVEETLI